MATWAVRRLRPKQFDWDRRCPHCNAQLLSCEQPGFCCGKQGKYRNIAPSLRPLPQTYNVFINDVNISNRSRQLNLIFSFASMETTATFPSAHGGMVAIQGRMYHRIRPNHGDSSVRWMLIDGMHPDHVPHLRRAELLPTSWLDAVTQSLRSNNPIARGLLTMHHASVSGQTAPTALHIELCSNGAAAEVAAIMSFSNISASELSPRSAIIITRGGETKQVPITSRLWEPLAYPLLFPFGEPGWGIDKVAEDHGVDQSLAFHRIDNNQGQSQQDVPTSQMWYYRRRLLSDSRFQIFGRLASEYMVDMFSRNLDCCLTYMKTNLTRIQQEESDLMGSDAPVPDRENIYMPASFLGSAKWSNERTADSLAVARAYGSPSFFITFTCNPKWPEITASLRAGQSWQDTPLAVARVFRGHLTRFLDSLKSAFPGSGRIEYLIHRIEFQKRGLPHAHILIRYENELTIADIDRVVSAEVPANLSDAALVREFMSHHHPSNGALGAYCDPKQTGKCRHGYPKPLLQETSIEPNGHVQYRRRNIGDEWIVGHCLPFVRAFQAHINFEVASSSKLFQYVFKYVHKRPDHAKVQLSREDGWSGQDVPYDEFVEYQTGRYLSAGEAAWRILGYTITSIRPAVTPLPIHTEASIRARQYRRKTGNQSGMTDLERYFLRPLGTYLDVNGHIREFEPLLYTEYYCLFYHVKVLNGSQPPRNSYLTLDDTTANSHRTYAVMRMRDHPHLARVVTVRPTAGEPYYIKLLLNMKAASSWENLRTVDGYLYSTFQEAAVAADLFIRGNEADLVMKEAVEDLSLPSQLRWLFTHLILNGRCESPLILWSEYSEHCSVDFFYGEAHEVHEHAEDLALQDIGSLLDDAGRRLSDFGLPEPRHYNHAILAEVRRHGCQPQVRAEKVTQAYNSFNPEQRAVFDAVTSSVMNGSGDAFFISGGAGRGKTFLVNALCDWVRSRGEIVIPTATSACAATLYEGGRTTHSTFKVSVNERNELISTGVLSGSPTASLLSATSLFVWDEAPMANRAVLSCVDEALQLATSVDSPFGGKTIVLLGDFRQNCPVVQHGTRQDVVDASIRYAPLWTTFRIFHLHAPIRNATDLQFSLWVDAIGNGLMKMPSLDMLNKLISIDDVIEWTFPEAILADPVSAARRSILAVTNQQIEYYNLRVLRHIHGEERTYYATDSVKDLDDNQIGVANSTRLFPSSADENSDTLDPHDMLSIFTKYTPPGCPPWALTVKEGAVYRLLRNFSISKGLVKNARVLVRKVGRHIVTVALIVQDQEGSQDLLIPRINFEATMPKCAYAMLRLQFPLAPAYATTFNSCQGLTLDRVAVDLTTSAFSHGQLYTALSRVRQRDHCAVRLPGSATCTQNVTYTELLI